MFCGASFMISDAKLRSTLFGGLIASTGSAVAYYFSSRAADQARADILTTTSRLAGTGASDKPVANTEVFFKKVRRVCFTGECAQAHCLRPSAFSHG